MRTPEFWLVEERCAVLQVNNVTRCFYEFHTLEDARRGYTIIQNLADRHFNKRVVKPFYPDLVINYLDKKGIKAYFSMG